MTLLEDEEGAVHLRGLSQHVAASEEDALNLLFLGDTNRAIAETPLNLASYRSHCIITVSIEGRDEGSSVVRRSKLHLVDLAGSERTGKTNASGQLLREATHINKSLHFLEMVIVALHEARRGGSHRSHIPYRNSLMTSVLRDSLGGNCRTTMIATINPEPEHTDESISTCRFAQRVARVQNCAVVNEVTDPAVLARQLRVRVTELEQELAFRAATGGDAGSAAGGAEPAAPLTDAERVALIAAARTWLDEPADAPADVGSPPTMERVRIAMGALKTAALEARRSATAAPAAAALEEDSELLRIHVDNAEHAQQDAHIERLGFVQGIPILPAPLAATVALGRHLRACRDRGRRTYAHTGM